MRSWLQKRIGAVEAEIKAQETAVGFARTTQHRRALPFVLLTLDQLDMTGVYDEDRSQGIMENRVQEFLEIEGRYYSVTV